MQDKRVNSHEIARLAGVSRSTVSRVVNNSNTVKDETRNRVLQVIQEYSYSPDISAQMLAGKPSRTIGLFFATNKSGNQMNAEDLLVNFMLERIIEIASDNDYFVLAKLVHNINQEENRSRICQMFTQRRIDGGIFIGFPNYYSAIEEMVASGYVVGIMDQHIPGRFERNRIVVNFDDNTIEKAVDYLVQLGHSDIMFVLGDNRRYNGVQKEEAAIRAMNRHGINIRKEWMLRGYFNRIPAKIEMEKFLNIKRYKLPTAIVCACDNMAYGVMEALEEKQVKIPDDISVIGVDDAFMSQYSSPPLTTFRVNFELMLRKLTESVISCIQSPLKDHYKEIFDSKLVIRNSCKTI